MTAGLPATALCSAQTNDTAALSPYVTHNHLNLKLEMFLFLTAPLSVCSRAATEAARAYILGRCDRPFSCRHALKGKTNLAFQAGEQQRRPISVHAWVWVSRLFFHS
jgi:hypothetical protein